jgi:hypothetical protein
MAGNNTMKQMRFIEIDSNSHWRTYWDNLQTSMPIMG